MSAENTGPVSGAMGRNPPAGAPAARLFLALWPDVPARRALCACQGAWHWPAGARVVAPEKLHITVHFLGDIAASRIPGIIAGLSFCFAPFELSLRRTLKWRRGLVVVAPDPVPSAYHDLHLRLAGALPGLGVAVDPRPVHPHVTLARRAGTARCEDRAAAEALRDARWLVREFVMAQSVASGGYLVLHRFPAS